jgi:hypothetical protein
MHTLSLFAFFLSSQLLFGHAEVSMMSESEVAVATPKKGPRGSVLRKSTPSVDDEDADGGLKKTTSKFIKSADASVKSSPAEPMDADDVKAATSSKVSNVI